MLSSPSLVGATLTKTVPRALSLASFSGVVQGPSLLDFECQNFHGKSPVKKNKFAEKSNAMLSTL